MKHYFVDTNVVIDMLANRDGFADAASELFDSAGRGEINVSYSEFTDYEDAIQYYSALQDSSINAIVTRNAKDFALSKLPVLSPGEYLE